MRGGKGGPEGRGLATRGLPASSFCRRRRRRRDQLISGGRRRRRQRPPYYSPTTTTTTATMVQIGVTDSLAESPGANEPMYE